MAALLEHPGQRGHARTADPHEVNMAGLCRRPVQDRIKGRERTHSGYTDRLTVV